MPSAQERAALTARMVRAVWRSGIGHPNCLNASLALWWLLARQGIASDLRVGVRKDGEKFEAHAWVECGGAALNEPETRHQHYASVRRSPRVAATRAAMSGFAGMVCTGDATPDPNLLERMAAGLGFRGPDATQIWSQAGAGFCFTAPPKRSCAAILGTTMLIGWTRVAARRRAPRWAGRAAART